MPALLCACASSQHAIPFGGDGAESTVLVALLPVSGRVLQWAHVESRTRSAEYMAKLDTVQECFPEMLEITLSIDPTLRALLYKAV